MHRSDVHTQITNAFILERYVPFLFFGCFLTRRICDCLDILDIIKLIKIRIIGKPDNSSFCELFVYQVDIS